jgi:hypothetical protein
MSRHSSRFVANRELWGALREHVRKGTGVRAAVAHFGRSGDKLFPLKRGDIIVVDLSIGAVRQGVTDPRALRILMERGVAIFSRPSLHAKFIIANQTLIASSANVSRNSRDILDEAGIITTDPAAVRRAADFFEKLCTSPVSKRYLRKCIAEYRPPRFKAAVETSSPACLSPNCECRQEPKTRAWLLSLIGNSNCRCSGLLIVAHQTPKATGLGRTNRRNRMKAGTVRGCMPICTARKAIRAMPPTGMDAEANPSAGRGWMRNGSAS